MQIVIEFCMSLLSANIRHYSGAFNQRLFDLQACDA